MSLDKLRAQVDSNLELPSAIKHHSGLRHAVAIVKLDYWARCRNAEVTLSSAKLRPNRWYEHDLRFHFVAC